PIPITSNSVILNHVNTMAMANTIPPLLILKPGIQELLLNNMSGPESSSNDASPPNALNGSSSNNMMTKSIMVPTTLSNHVNAKQALTSSGGAMKFTKSPNRNAINNKPLSSSGGSPGAGANNPLRNQLNFTHRTANFSLGEQRDQNVKALMQRRKLTQIQIGSLLGKPLCWSNGENEIKDFRTKMETIFNFNEIDLRDRVKITLASITTCSGADPLLPSSFHIRFYLPPDNHSTTISVNGIDLISEIIERVIAKHHTTKMLQDQKPSDFVIRITGTSDHVLKDCQVMDLDVVRNRLQRKKDIKFSLVHRSSIPDCYIDGHSEPICHLP
ncbi:hypothetical protein SAMD00019534_062670, partial [Acytostelium subglobosum LB1]|uniref:hypothetical protein n=1 Tax=Acytostelium subglobosum LB1 TaxID=1410327 RepID=UPI00064501F5